MGFLIGISAVLLAYLLWSSGSAWEAGAACVLPFALLAGAQRLGRAGVKGVVGSPSCSMGGEADGRVLDTNAGRGAPRTLAAAGHS